MTFADNARVTTLVNRERPKLDELPSLRASLQHAIKHEQWFTVCCMCSVIGELLFASLDPTNKADKLPKLSELRVTSKRAQARHKQRGQKRNDAYYLVAALRHTCFHPAMTEPIRDLPKDVFATMSSLHRADAADWALEQLEVALSFDLGLRERPFSH